MSAAGGCKGLRFSCRGGRPSGAPAARPRARGPSACLEATTQPWTPWQLRSSVLNWLILGCVLACITWAHAHACQSANGSSVLPKRGTNARQLHARSRHERNITTVTRADAPTPARSWFTTVAPLVFVLAVNAIKEGYDDACRHRNDSQINNRRVLMLDAEQGEVSVFWKDVVAGDLIKVRAGGVLLGGDGAQAGMGGQGSFSVPVGHGPACECDSSRGMCKASAAAAACRLDAGAG